MTSATHSPWMVEVRFDSAKNTEGLGDALTAVVQAVRPVTGFHSGIDLTHKVCEMGFDLGHDDAARPDAYRIKGLLLARWPSLFQAVDVREPFAYPD